MNIRAAIVSILIAIGVIAGVLFILISHRAPVPEEPAVFATVVPESEKFEAVMPSAPEASAFEFEIVASPEARQQGLSGRTSVPGNYGMLFVFDTADRYGFWMKDMLVSIDIIWLANDGTIIAIEDSVSPETYPTPFYPPQAVSFVLETRAGEARTQGWVPGTKLNLPVSR